MGKKHREPEPEKSAFENAKAAFERAVEEDIPVMKTAKPSKDADAPANPETPGPETESPETQTPASDSATPDSDSGGDGAEPPPSSADSDTTEADADSVEADTTEPDSDDSPATPDAEPAEEYDDEDEDDFPDDTGPEVTEMETHTMEMKEITLGYHRSQPAESDTRPYETQPDKEPKAKIQFKAFDKFKDAFRVQEEQADEAKTAGSSRDAALRKRVMQIEDEETRNYLLDRVLPQMAWYSAKSAQYQAMYYRLMGATILLGALIPAFAVGANNTAVKVILALLGASVTGLNAYIALHNYHDLWITYRTTREDLIHHLYCYFNHAGAFSSAEDLDVLLVNVCEDTMSKEHGGWTTILQKT